MHIKTIKVAIKVSKYPKYTYYLHMDIKFPNQKIVKQNLFDGYLSSVKYYHLESIGI